jgi:hypothetical protein
MTPSIISTPDVTRILSRAAANSSTIGNLILNSFSMEGHNFLVIELRPIGLTLCYDIGTQLWSIWTQRLDTGIEVSYANGSFCRVGNAVYALNSRTGLVSEVSFSTQTDEGETLIPIRLRTPPLDGGTTNKKFLAALNIKADTVNAPCDIRYSDTDCQSWSNPRPVQLSTIRKQLRRLGSFRRRNFELQYIGIDQVAFESLELDIALGIS